MKKNLVCILSTFSCGDYVKDSFMVPYYIGKLHKMSVSLVFHSNKDSASLENQYKGVHLIPLSSIGIHTRRFGESWTFVHYLLRNAKKIDVLMCFHFSYRTILLSCIYKLCNPKGLFYLKSDGYGLWAALFRKGTWFPNQKYRDGNNIIVKIKNICIRLLLYIGVRQADKVSVETPEVYNYLKKQSPFLKKPEKLIWMLNGIDEEAFESYKLSELPIKEKQNWIISVGRHGNWQKNTEMFLKALSLVDLKNWKVFLIGTIEPEFNQVIEKFYTKNNHLRNSVQFIGPIYDQKLLWKYYNEAKVFVHTAVYESYGIVLGEAFRFNDYILSTDVGIASEFIKQGYGCLIPNSNSNLLSKQLQLIIDGKINLDSLHNSCNLNNRSFSWENEVSKLGMF